jgi:HSP20 family protein
MPKTFAAHISQSVMHVSLSQGTGQGAWTPNTDVYETTDRLVVKMELAGVESDELEVFLQDRLLVVAGYREDTCRKQSKRCTFRQMEIDYGHFERRLVLPVAVDVSRAQARMRNGFLRIDLPKTTRSTPVPATVVVIEDLN